MIHCQLSVRRRFVIAQYERDQAVASACDQALARVLPNGYREHILKSGVFEER